MTVPSAERAGVRVHEPIVLSKVDANPTLPFEIPDEQSELPRIRGSRVPATDDPEVHGMSLRVLAVRRHFVPFLP